MYLYYNENNEIKMMSDKKIDATNFEYINKKLTEDDKKKLLDVKYDKKIKNKKLHLKINNI